MTPKKLTSSPSLKGGDSSVEGTMPRTENTERSLIAPMQQAVPVAQLTGNRSAETLIFNTIVGGVIAIADPNSIVEKKADCVRRTIHPLPKGRGLSCKLKVSPYSFSVKKESSRSFAYQVTCYPYRNVLAGGIVNSRRDAERCARQDIRSLESLELVKEQAA